MKQKLILNNSSKKSENAKKSINFWGKNQKIFKKFLSKISKTPMKQFFKNVIFWYVVQHFFAKIKLNKMVSFTKICLF